MDAEIIELLGLIADGQRMIVRLCEELRRDIRTLGGVPRDLPSTIKVTAGTPRRNGSA